MTRHSIRLLLTLLLGFPLTGLTQNVFYDNHYRYKEVSIQDRRSKHYEIEHLIKNSGLAYKQVGASVENRPLYLVSYGDGPIQVLLWSQMHGNEPTATMALMDIFNFLTAEDEFDSTRERLSDRLTIHFIPMLNPDGAERFQRRNVQGIDINRDALRLQTPEGQTLKRVRDSLDADWGFNLHDQGRATKVNNKSATISVLAPAYNYETDIDEKREDAMQLIGMMNEQVQKYYPGYVGRYWDDFEPRAFGDNLQKWGTRTILIESGGLLGDREKQLIRRINFMMILSSLESIADGTYDQYSVNDYMAIPNNQGRNLQELIIRNVNYDGSVRDIAFGNREVQNDNATDFYLEGYITDIGDLSTAHAYQELDAEEYEVRLGQYAPKTYETIKELVLIDEIEMIRDGITEVALNREFDPFVRDFLINVRESNLQKENVDVGENPSFVFSKEGEVHFAVINSFLIDLRTNEWTEIEWNEKGEAEWEIQNGVVIGSQGSGSGFMVSDKRYGNFELELEFKPDTEVNSGVFIRIEDVENITAYNSYEINIWDNNTNQNFRTGGVVNFSYPLEKVNTLNRWNTYRIKADGPKIEAWINGIKTTELVDDKNKEGHLGLQLFQSGKIEFRNIRIREL